jgi:iron complex outermembrane receptor protein
LAVSYDKNAIYYRLNFKLPSQIGTWNASAYYGKENRDYSMMEWKDRKDHSKGIQDGSWETIWHQQGCKISNQFQPAKDHVVTVGGELEQLYDGYGNVPGWNNTPLAHDDKKRIETLSTFIQDRWSIMPNLTLTTGLRYEDDTILVKNYSTSSGNTYITGRKMWIKRSWSELIPKSFLTYELDDLAKGLRDTSISIGVSKIWRAPDYHGDYNPQGKPAGAWLEPEHGIGYDLVFNRRLFNNINMKFNYSYSQIKDYIAQNNSYSKYWPRGGKAIKPGLEYMDYKINLDEVIRQGIEIQLNGNITDDLDFLLGYAWQDFNNQGNEPAGKTELDNRPTDQVFAKLVYKLFNPTKLILEYEYQSEQIIVKADKIAADVHEFSEIAIDSFHLFNFGVEQTLFSKWNSFSNGVLKLYVKNLFGEDYKNATGYPATDRTFGIAFSFSI